MFNDRKTSYKLPPTTIRDRLVSQEARRTKALEEQKRRRAQRVDSTRQLDLFSGLNIGASDDEDEVIEEETIIAPASVAQYAALLEPSSSTPANAITSFSLIPSKTDVTFTSIQPSPSRDKPAANSNKKRKNNKRGRGNKPSKWADKCMYAELLEMASDSELWSSSMDDSEENINDGLPRDLETGWVAVAPVPVGKRCLAVTHQSAGVVGVAPNTTLRSRLLGKTLIHRFPSPLPPLTILDCILDVNWRDNGILHVLDVIKWKGQDVADCEAGFRFWWRDTRLAELTQSLPPSTAANPHFVPIAPATANTPPLPELDSIPPSSLKYAFPYPTTFLPIPYHASTTLTALDGQVVPAARSTRVVQVRVPLPPRSFGQGFTEGAEDGGMDVEPASSAMSMPTAAPFTFHVPSPSLIPILGITPPPPIPTTTSFQTAHIQPDGLLLYVAEASYEPGTSPLSSWVPLRSYDADEGQSHVVGVNGGDKGKQRQIRQDGQIDGPLDIFQRLVKRRLSRRPSLPGTGSTGAEADVEMDL